MRRRRETAPEAASKGSSSGEASDKSTDGAEIRTNVHVGNPRRSSFVWLALFLIIIYCCSAVYRYQFQSMPIPLTAEQAGKRGFSEIEAFKHVKALTEVGPHPVGSEALHLALQVGSSTLLFFSPVSCCILSNSMSFGQGYIWFSLYIVLFMNARLVSLLSV